MTSPGVLRSWPRVFLPPPPHPGQRRRRKRPWDAAKGQGQCSQARRRNRTQALGEQTPLLRTWGHRASQGRAAPGAKCRAKGGAPSMRLPTSGQDPCSAAGAGELPPAPRPGSIPSFPSPSPSQFKPPAKPSTVNRKPGDASGAAEIPAAPQTLALPGSHPGVHQMLPLRGLHEAPHAPRGVREGARPPCPVRPGSCARDAAPRAVPRAPAPAPPARLLLRAATPARTTLGAVPLPLGPFRPLQTVRAHSCAQRPPALSCPGHPV